MRHLGLKELKTPGVGRGLRMRQQTAEATASPGSALVEGLLYKASHLSDKVQVAQVPSMSPTPSFSRTIQRHPHPGLRVLPSNITQ